MARQFDVNCLYYKIYIFGTQTSTFWHFLLLSDTDLGLALISDFGPLCARLGLQLAVLVIL